MRSHLTGAVISLRFWQVYHSPFPKYKKGLLCSVKKQKSISWDALFLEATSGFGPENNGFADRGLTTWLRYRAAEKSAYKKWSGLRGSNSLPPPWQGGALPNELNPHNVCIGLARRYTLITRYCMQFWCLRSELNQRHGDFQSPALPTELQRHIPATAVREQCR